MTHSRRDVLLGTSALTAGALAGCLDDLGQGDDQWATASFYTLYDFTRQITGDRRAIDNAVPSGQHGHGWQPSADMLPSIVESELFIYLDSEGFQPWVDGTIDQIEQNHAEDVVLVDALEGIDLLEYDDDQSHDHDHSHDQEDDAHSDDGDGDDPESTLEVHAIDLIDADTDAVVADAHDDHWHGDPLEIAVDDSLSLEAEADTEAGTVDGSEDEYDLTARNDGDSSALEVDAHGDHLHVRGTEDGMATIVVGLTREGETVWEAPPLEVRIGEGYDHDDGHSDDDGHGHSHDQDDHSHEHDDDVHSHEHDDDGHSHDHSHGEYDAKFFSDPVLAQRGVENIRDALIEVDPDNESVYAENAAAYIEDLEALHEEFESTLSDREHDHVVLAGHDSFQYLGERYGFEIHTPVGLSPDDSPSGQEIAAAVDFVEDHGIEYVLWDYFDGDDLANEIAAEADTVTDTVMVSPAESVVEEWDEAGHGDYVGQMREINLPAFERALGAE